jgi:hypothetical protein
MQHTTTDAGPPPADSPAPTPITQALACYADTRSHGFTGHTAAPNKQRRLVRPQFKRLVLQAIPTARVCRNPEGTYECFIGPHRLSNLGQHNAADRAWLRFARYADSHEFMKAKAAGAFK